MNRIHIDRPRASSAFAHEFYALQAAVSALKEAEPTKWQYLGTVVKRGQWQAVNVVPTGRGGGCKVSSVTDWMDHADLLVWLRAQAPRLSSCVSVLIAMGFEEIHTGGGCTALYFKRPDGEYCMVTDDATAPKDTDKNWDVGFYDEKAENDGVEYEIKSYARGHKNGFIAALERIAKWRVG